MTKLDKMTFWIIEIVIVVLVFRPWDICYELHTNDCVTTHSSMIWVKRFYQHIPEISPSLILFGTIMNVSALYCGKLKSIKELSVIDKVIIRICAAIVAFTSLSIVFLIINYFLN